MNQLSMLLRLRGSAMVVSPALVLLLLHYAVPSMLAARAWLLGPGFGVVLFFATVVVALLPRVLAARAAAPAPGSLS